MLSASGLLYNWRSCAGRSHADPDPALDSLSSAGDPHLRHPRRHRDRRRRPVPGPPIDPRRLPYPQTEHEPSRPDNGHVGESMTGSISHGASAGSTLDRLRLNRYDQLPGVVLQARARLQERLRGISLSGSRNEIAVGDDVRIMNPVDWDTDNPSELNESDPLPTNLTPETDGDIQYVNRPPGLTSEAFCNLQLEVYQDGADDNNVARAFLECSICLEKFLEGDEMIRLSCGHRFHPSCLEPWVKTCGDCPYCRTRI